MSDNLPSEEIVSHRVGGATYEAISQLYEISTAKARYICRRAAMAGMVTPEQIGWRKQAKPLRIAPEDYNGVWINRVLSQVKQDADGCWIWQGSIHPKGYGQTNYRGRTVRVHRKLYELIFTVELSSDQCICHRCDVPRCCNPLHIFLGDNAINMADKTKKGRHHAQQVTHCPKGHPYDEQNTYMRGPTRNRPNGARSCKACAQIRSRIKLGWTQEQAESLPVTPPGLRPVNARKAS